MSIRYSFIIPVKTINHFIQEAVPKILEIRRSDYEILIFPDSENPQFKWDKTRQIPTGLLGPAEKRDLALNHARGQYLVFIDDDAYPNIDFLDILDESFTDLEIIAVGGPAITPSSDSFWQKVSGAVFLSNLSGGFPERYYSMGEKRFVDDWPSVNLTVRYEAFAEVGGFGSEFWPGEDTKLCLDLIQKVKGKIIYNPELIVWHHRRQGLLRHLKQIGRYGLHRGYFAKLFPQTSMRYYYFIPSLFLCFVVLSPLSFYSYKLSWFVILGYILYITALAKAFWDIFSKEKNIRISLCSLCYIVPTHLYYGLQFLKGFIFKKELKSRLRS
jgi:GT2 family glycosyltransferase